MIDNRYDRSTDELNEIIRNTSPSEIDSYLEKNKKYLADDDRSFYYYFTDVIKEKNIKLKDVYSFAGISESQGGKIIRMERHTSNRDNIILLCACAHFTLEETNRSLKLYGFNELYSRDPRDACIIVALHNRVYNMCDIDDMLLSQGLEPLSKIE